MGVFIVKNDLVRRFATVLGCLSFCFVAQAEDAEETPETTVKEFSGASADLSSAENWGGELPGPTNIAVIDVAKLGDGVTTLTMSEDLSVAGLRVDNNDRNLVIAPASGASVKLTFGTCGFTNSVNVMDFQKGVGFKMPLVVSGAQTWNCGKQNLTTWSTISGSDTLTFVNAAFIIHYEAVRYGGKIHYNCPNISSAWQWTTSVRAYSGDLWAAELDLACNGWLCLTNRTSWSRLFSKRSVVTTASFGLNIRYPEKDGNPGRLVGMVDFGDGDRFKSTGASGASHGFLNIAGGLKVSDPACDMSVIAAVLSSTFDMPITSDVCFAGEVGLSGEIRPVGQTDRRVSEAARLGFKKIFVSKYASVENAPKGIEVIKLADVPELVRKLFR